EQALEIVFDKQDQSLLIGEWRQFSEHQQAWLLRRWLQALGLRPPSQAVLQTINEQLIGAGDSANPRVVIQGFQIRKYRHKLFCIANDFLHKGPQVIHWRHEDFSLPMSNGYCIQRIETSAGIDRQLWDTHVITVVSRSGGEKIKIPGREGRHCLKKLYQEAGIPPWEREVRPLIYLNGRLAAVAGLWVDEWAWSAQGSCYGLLWQP
ncbi:MAG: tRNA lysidine(34) synthetase TilS, partial [Methylomonas sp.]